MAQKPYIIKINAESRTAEARNRKVKKSWTNNHKFISHYLFSPASHIDVFSSSRCLYNNIIISEQTIPLGHANQSFDLNSSLT